MNFYKSPLSRIAVCFILFSFTLFPHSLLAQTDDTETPDTTWFTDVTDKVNLNHMVNPGGLLIVDVNNDEYPDLITYSGLGSDTGCHLYINEERPGSTDPTDRIFVDETANSGLNIPGVYHDLAGAADFDNDGNIDIVTNCWPLDNQDNCVTVNPAKERLRIWWGDGQGHFTLDSIASSTPTGLEQLGVLSGSGLPALDYDRDGNLDLFVACHYTTWCVYGDAFLPPPDPSHLMHNNGDRTFSDSTAAAGINISQADPRKPWLTPPSARGLFGANMSDWNNDCWPDIFTCPYEATGYPFIDTAAGDAGFTSAHDTANTEGYGNLYENLGGQGKIGKFKDVGITANYDPHFAWSIQGIVPWSALPGDYNNDGNMDYLVLEVHGDNVDSSQQYYWPYEFPDGGNGRTCIFTNLGPDSGYKLKPDVGRINRTFPINNPEHGDHTGCWIDMNNDGYLDCLIGDAVYGGSVDNQRIFFELQDTLTHDFNDITCAVGPYCHGTGALTQIDNTTAAYKIRRPGCLAPIDYDLDGDDDIIKIPYSWPSDSILMLRNNVGNRNNHVTIKLIAPSDVNKSCIGARIRVVSGDLKQMRDIVGDQGQWTNEYPFIQNFGLGKRTMIDTIDIRWPNNDCTHTIITHVSANQFLRIDSQGISGIMPVGPNAANNFTLYPNPDAGNTLNVKFQGPINPFIEIYNELGQQVADYKPGYASLFFLPVENLPAGLYFIHIIGGPAGTVLTQSFVKTNPQ